MGDGITHADALAFVHQLVDAQVLVPDLGPVVTGPDALDDLIARLARHAPAHPLRPALAEARDALAALDAPGSARRRDVHDWRNGSETLAPADRSRLFQVDVHRPAPQATLGESLVDELLRATDLLVGLFMKGRADSLDEFRRAFEERYGDREVPLAPRRSTKSWASASARRRDRAPIPRRCSRGSSSRRRSRRTACRGATARSSCSGASRRRSRKATPSCGSSRRSSNASATQESPGCRTPST
ncbi:MAG: lantibiotic dehydratase [Candidatus Eisenbacteria bacterium]|nr:lantibiotic dehydratase [Candidatus Eisenbacteria bacterium]